MKKYILIRRAIKYLLLMVVFFNGQLLVYGQTIDTLPDVPNYDIAKQRLLLRSTSQYLYSALQGQIDLDSTQLIACSMYKLSRLLPYNEGYSDGKPSAGSTLIDAGKINEAKALLTNLKNEEHERLLLELSTYFIFKPGKAKEDLAQAEKYIREAIALSKTIKSLNWENESLTLLGHWQFQSQLYKESAATFASVTDVWSKTKNEKAHAQALLAQATHLAFADPNRITTLEKAIVLFRKIGAKEKEIETLSEIIVMHFSFQPSVAEKELLEIIELQKAIGYQHNQYAYDVLTFLNNMNGNQLLSQTYSDKSMASMKFKADFFVAPIFYHRRGTLYAFMGNHDEAFRWYKRALENKTRETRFFWYSSGMEIVNVLTMQHKHQEAVDMMREITREYPPSRYDSIHIAYTMGAYYEHANQYSEAEKYYDLFDELVQHYPAQHVQGYTGQVYASIAELYIKTRKKQKAKEYIRKAQALYSKQMDIGSAASIHETLFQIDTLEGNYKSAVKNLILYKFYYDSSFRLETHKAMDELLVKYEAEKKDKDIQLLTQQTDIKEAQLQQSTFVRNITFIGAVVVFIIAGLLYYLFRSKQKSNNQLKQLLEEKEWLLKEVHHRVKNNLQTVLSLLESQSRQLSNEALYALQDSQNRVYAMSLIHKKLYQSTDVATINMEDYLRDLIQHLRESLSDSSSIRFTLTLDPVELDVSQAVPIGLIVNEAITNAIKYAFPEKKEGSQITISLKQNIDNKVELQVADNGIGITDSKKENTGTLGLKLMRGLTEDIDGDFQVQSEYGVSITVSFVVNAPLPKMSRTTTPQLAL